MRNQQETSQQPAACGVPGGTYSATACDKMSTPKNTKAPAPLQRPSVPCLFPTLKLGLWVIPSGLCPIWGQVILAAGRWHSLGRMTTPKKWVGTRNANPSCCSELPAESSCLHCQPPTCVGRKEVLCPSAPYLPRAMRSMIPYRHLAGSGPTNCCSLVG